MERAAGKASWLAALGVKTGQKHPFSFPLRFWFDFVGNIFQVPFFSEPAPNYSSSSRRFMGRFTGGAGSAVPSKDYSRAPPPDLSPNT